MSSELLNLRASALNQNDQHKNKEHAGSNSDNCRSVHRVTPFPCLDPSNSPGAAIMQEGKVLPRNRLVT